MLTSLPLDNGARCRATGCTSAATYFLNRDNQALPMCSKHGAAALQHAEG